MTTSSKLSHISEAIKKGEIERKTRFASNDAMDNFDLQPVNIELFPEEVVYAAQQALGQKKLSDMYVSLYSFARDAKDLNAPIRVQQLSGVLMTHNTIKDWLSKNDVSDVYAMENPFVIKMYWDYMRKQLHEVTDALDKLSKMLGG